MRKLFTFLCAALMSVSMWAADPIVWDEEFCKGVQAFCDMFKNVNANNSKDGITVTYTGAVTYDGFKDGKITLSKPNSTSVQASVLTFTSTVDITRIDIYCTSYFNVPAGWTYDKGMFSWTGDATKTIQLALGDQQKVLLDKMVQIVFNGTGEPLPSFPLEGDTWDDATKTLTVNANPAAKIYANKPVVNLIIAAAVTEIGEEAFAGNADLENVKVLAAACKLGKDAFKDCAKLAKIVVPTGKGNDYKAADGWKDFASKIEEEPAPAPDPEPDPDLENVILSVKMITDGLSKDGFVVMGTFTTEPVKLELNTETGWYVNFHVQAKAEQTFYFVDAANNDNVLLQYKEAEGKWAKAEFVFGQVWKDDTWKGDPVKTIELNLSDKSKYAWGGYS